MAIIYRKVNRDDPRERVYTNVTRKGKLYVVAGEQLELFTITVLCEALDRTLDTIVAWEKECWCGGRITTAEGDSGVRLVCSESCETPARVFPRPLVRVDQHSLKRWYTGAQVMNLHNLMHYRYGGAKNHKFDKACWAIDVRRVFRHHNKLVVDEKGGVHDVPIRPAV